VEKKITASILWLNTLIHSMIPLKIMARQVAAVMTSTGGTGSKKTVPSTSVPFIPA